MLRWLWRRCFSWPVEWQRSIVELSDLEALARSGLAGMLLAQEKARLDYLRAREGYERGRCRETRNRMNDRLANLQATNAVVQSLLNEHLLEQRLAAGADSATSEFAVVKSR